MTKELDNIFEAINKWIEKHDGKVQFIGGFMAFKGKDFKVTEDRILAYGVKEALEMDLDELSKELKKEKKEFVNW